MSATEEGSPLLPRTARTRSSVSWWQVVGAGAGFLTDAYDLFVIDLVLHIVRNLHAEVTVWHQSAIVAAASVGAVIGQVCFGLCADYLGRRVNFIASCSLLLVGALLSASVDIGAPLQLAAARFVLGVGIGGEYPLAATIAAESEISGTDALTRTALVFSMQGVGMLLSCVVVLVPAILGVDLEVIWRLALGLGVVVPAVVLVQRARMEETEGFQRVRDSGGGNAVTVGQHAASLRDAMWDYRWQLLGTGGSWFLLDVCFYAFGSFKSRIYELIFVTKSDNLREEIVGAAGFATVMTCAALAGFLLSVAFLSRIGWARLQSWGFFVLAMLFMLFGSVQSPRGLSVVALLIFVCFNFGPNTTAFVAPVDVYPVRFRASAHGFSAAMGKVGAALGTAAFGPLEAAYDIRAVAYCAAAICIGGIYTTHLAAPIKQPQST